MAKFVLIPDSFKGTLRATEFCAIVKEELLRAMPGAAVIAIPVADGGEGTVEAFLTALGGERIAVSCTGPYGEPVTACYALLHDGTAVIEMAAAAGLPMAGARRDPEATTTYGVGQLMAHAAHHGAKAIVLGLGGSATNDGGCGCAAALGIRFLDKDGAVFVPTGGTLQRIAAIDRSGLDPAVASLAVTAMCDIDNPLCGCQGAAAVFAPQKGADEAMVQRLDAGLYHLAQCIRTHLGAAVLDLAGGGAAGGFGAGAAAFFSATLCPGIETVLRVTDFDSRAACADRIITGEGRLDSQSLGGKVVIGVARRARELGVPVTALVGSFEECCLAAARAEGVTEVVSINPPRAAYEAVKDHAAENLRATAKALAQRLLQETTRT